MFATYSPRTSQRPHEASASMPNARCVSSPGGASGRACRTLSATNTPRAADTPTVNAATGCHATRPATCPPRLFSLTFGSDSDPTVYATAASNAGGPTRTSMPVSHRSAATVGTPLCGEVSPTGYRTSQPLPFIASRSSTVAGIASARTEVRY